jgi:Zn-dependent protease
MWLELSGWAILPVAVVLLLGVAKFGWLWGLLATVLLANTLLLHEFAHLAAAVATRTPVLGVGFSIKGLYIRRKTARRRSAEIFIAAAGPLMNLLLAGLLWNGDRIMHWVAVVNAVLGISNLAPIGGTDGQRIVSVLRKGVAAPAP